MEDIKQNGQYPVVHGSHNLDYLKKTQKFPYLNSEVNPYVKAFWKWFPDALPHLKVLRLTGGEPTMSKETWRLLDMLIENPMPDLEVAINTNLCVPSNLIDKLIEKINDLKGKVKKIDVYTSLESTNEQAEYARDGLDYKQWINNMHQVLQQTESTVAIMTTVNILSLPTFTNFIDLVMDFRKQYNKAFEYNRVPISINYLRWPPHLQCTLLDKEDRELYANAIEKLCESWLKYHSPDKYARLYLEEWDQIKRFCDYLRNTDPAIEHRNDFVAYIQAYDKRRRKNFRKVFEDYRNIIEDWNA
jgi:organic radical activating enzyme